MYKVKLNSSLSVKDFTICVIILFFVYLFCRVHNLNLNPIYFIIALVIGGGLEFINSDDVVVSDLIVNARDIELIYKKEERL